MEIIKMNNLSSYQPFKIWSMKLYAASLLEILPSQWLMEINILINKISKRCFCSYKKTEQY